MPAFGNKPSGGGGSFSSGLLKFVSVAASLFVSAQILSHLYECLKVLDGGDERKESFDQGLKKMRKLKVSSRNLSSRQMSLAADIVTPDEIALSFDDIGGLSEAKLELKNNVLLPMKLKPQLNRFKNMLIKPPAGIIFYGPPGCGKTMLAMALAKAANCKILCLKSSSLFDKFNGETEKNIRALFELVSKIGPVFVFIDELDCVFRKRNDFGCESKVFLSEFLIFLDKLGGKDDAFKDCFFIGATNRIKDIDDAVLRRFPQMIEIDKPNEASRLSILKKILKYSKIDDADVYEIARVSISKTGSDLYEICRNATINSLSEFFENCDPNAIDSKDIPLNLCHFKGLLPELDNDHSSAGFNDDIDSLYH